MPPQNTKLSDPQPHKSLSTPPTVDTAQIYPTPVSTKVVSPNSRPPQIKLRALNNYPPLGVVIISIVIILQSASGIWLGLAHGSGGFYTLIYGLQLLLGLGLLSLHEMARLVYVALSIVSLALQIPSLVFVTNFLRLSSGYKLYAWAVVGVEIAILIYLSRPSIKDHFA